MDRRGWLVMLGIVVAVGAGAWGWNEWTAAQEEAASELRREARAARPEEHVGQLIAESRPLMPSVVEGVALGMPLSEVRTARGARMTLDVASREHPLLIYEELLGNGGRAIYGFTRRGEILVQVQILSLLPTVDAIAPHLAAMNEQYGRPTGIWDCPTTGGVPTRRFTWRGSHVTVSDVFLLYGERVSLTLYIATTEQIGLSLQMASCTPVTADRLDAFPVATPEQMQSAQSGR